MCHMAASARAIAPPYLLRRLARFRKYKRSLWKTIVS
jgi:uncharacterized protein YjiS (DUF1127 family)